MINLNIRDSSISSIDTIYTIDDKIEMIMNLYKSHDNINHFGKNVKKTEHMVQCALEAQKNNEDEFIILTCLLYDIGHLLDQYNMNGFEIMEYGLLGYYYLKDLNMDARICYLIKKNVDAKRYLVTIDENNYNNLSDSLKERLEYQGGRMNNEELISMEKNDEFLNILKVHKYHNMDKLEDKEIPDIETFIPLLRKYL